MQVNLPQGISLPNAASVAANIAAKNPIESKDVQDMTKATTELKALEAELESQEANANELQDPDQELIKSALSQVVDAVDLIMPSVDVKYEICDEANMVQVQVIKKDSGEVIRKIPDDMILQIISRIHQMLNAEPEDEEGIDVMA